MSLQCCRNPINFIKSNCAALQRLIDNVDAIISSAGGDLPESNTTHVTTIIGDGENSALIELSLSQQNLGFKASHLKSYILIKADSLTELSVTNFSGITPATIIANLSGEENSPTPTGHYLITTFQKENLIFNPVPDPSPSTTEVVVVIGAGDSSALIQLSPQQQLDGFVASDIKSYVLIRVDSLLSLSVTNLSNVSISSLVANLSAEENTPNGYHLIATFQQ